MKRTVDSPPYLSVCLIVRNCEDTLEACLKSIRERAPECELVIVDTCSRDRTVEIAQQYADVFEVYRGPRGDWNEDMFAFDDAAAARQRSFDLSTGDWVMWVDSDDRLAGPEEAERLLKLNGRWRPTRPLQETIAAADEPEALEDVLRNLEKNYPDASCCWAPYLYQRDEHGNAITWQERERIVYLKGDRQRYTWKEAAHEVLVARPGISPPRVYLAGLLYVHEKKFDDEAYNYNLRRHFAIFIQQYENGEATPRRCLYLANQAKFFCPERELEFLRASHRLAATSFDRYHALIGIAGYYAERGLRHDFVENMGAACALHPDLPDAWLAAGEHSVKAQDWESAIVWLERGLSCDATQPASFINPRHFAIRYPTLLAVVLQRQAGRLVSRGKYTEAVAHLKRAEELTIKVSTSEMAGADKPEAEVRYLRARNALLAEEQAAAIQKLWVFLCDNDEPQKAQQLLKAVPHMLEDHPHIIWMERWVRGLETHVASNEAYRNFYNSSQETGYIPMSARWLAADEVAMPRTKWITEELLSWRPDAEVLDVGAADGTVGVPLVEACRDIRYTGVDIGEEALGHLRSNFEKRGEMDRVELYLTKDGTLAGAGLPAGKKYDAILWCEVIEHVPDPVKSLAEMRSYLKPDGRIYMSTPWGSFDVGLPPKKNWHGGKRDERGHLRVVSPREMDAYVTSAGLDLAEMFSEGPEEQKGVTMHAVAVPSRRVGRPIAITAPAALWNWTGRQIHREGIGASEKMLVYLAEALAWRGHSTAIYGPVPGADTHKSVRYWPKEHLRHLYGSDAKLLISRFPKFAETADELIGRVLPKVLWLQDAFYPELNAQVAEKFEKIVVVSQWHKDLMHAQHGVPLDKMQVIYNAIRPEQFSEQIARKRTRFVYASSPDRGLARLVRLWPRVVEKYPDAELHVYYGWRGCEVLSAGVDDLWRKRHADARAAYEKYRYTKGIVEHGMVSGIELARVLKSSGIWAYPTDFHETCVHPDTLISMPGDHRNGNAPVRVPIADLVGRTNFPVYAYDEEAHRFRIATARAVAKTKDATELLALDLDDGGTLKVTPDHRIMTFDGDWVRADALKPGDRLKALHHRYAVMIKDADGRWVHESRLVGEWLAGRPLRPDEHVDHIDETRLDNRPEALRVLTAAEHHSKTHKGQARPWHLREASTARIVAWARDPQHKAVLTVRNAKNGKKLQDWLRSLGPMARQAWFDERARRAKATVAERMKDPAYAAARSEAGRRAQQIQMARRVGDTAPQNHRVVAVRRLPGCAVYDMQVDGLHNFIADGVVVHNCCTLALEARAAGCVPVTTALAALNETAACPQARLIPPDAPDYDDAWLKAVDEVIDTSDVERAKMAIEAAAQYDMDIFVPVWEELLS